MTGNCDVCGRYCDRLIGTNNGYKVCNKHYRQYKKFGKFLDNNPRTISDRNEYHICGDITYIDLYNIKCEVVAQAIIDTEDLDKVKDIKWKLSTTGYAMNTQKGGIENRRPNLHMSRVIYGEARGEPYTGQVAVGAVVMNRIKSSSFPNTLSGVVYQSGAFDAVKDGQVNLTPDSTARKAAQDAMNGWDPSYGAIYYFNPSTATNKWIWSRPMTVTIGKHRFCK